MYLNSKAVVLLLLIHCFMSLKLFVGFLFGICFVMHYFVPFLVLQKRELAALLLLSS